MVTKCKKAIICKSIILLGLLIDSFSFSYSQDIIIDIHQPPASDFLSTNNELRRHAELITVKVLSGQSWGSGILIEKQGNRYTIVTNRHVLNFTQTIPLHQIETPDGKIYTAQIVEKIDFTPYDLAVLQFESKHNYQTISLTELSLAKMGEQVYAVGFPFEGNTSHPRGLMFTQGKVAQISHLSFRGGYQIGYTNTVKKGMSGGPLLNQSGEVIGINGRHKYPLWGNPYIFEDGSIASPEQKTQMSQLSWAIPIQTFLELMPSLSKLSSNFIN